MKSKIRFLKYWIPLIESLQELGGSGKAKDVTDYVIKKMNIPPEALEDKLKGGGSKVRNDIAWARSYLGWRGFIDSSQRGVWALTEKGLKAKLTEDDVYRLFKQGRINEDVNEDEPPITEITDNENNENESLITEITDNENVNEDEPPITEIIETHSELFKEKWEEICFSLSESINIKEIREDIFELKVLLVIEKVLGWSQFKKEIELKPNIPVGSGNSIIPDIVMYHNKKPLIIIEVKRPNLQMNNQKYLDQVKSYMRMMKVEFGLLIGNEIHVFYESYKKGFMRINKIPFDRESTHGLNFVAMFNKSDFLENRYENIIKSYIANIEKIQKIHELRRVLRSDETKQKIYDYLRKEHILIQFWFSQA